MQFEQGQAKHNFCRRVYTQTAKLADIIILLHYQIASINFDNDSIPMIWIPFLKYVVDSSKLDEFRYLFVARYSMENKNRKLPCRLKEYESKFKTLDVKMFIKNSLPDLCTFREVQLIFESVFSTKKANSLWKYSSIEIKKSLKNYVDNNVQCNNFQNRDCLNRSRNEIAGKQKDYTDISESKSRLTELYRHNPSFFDELIENCISIDLSSEKECYEIRKIVSIELKDLLDLCKRPNTSDYKILYDDLKTIAEYSSEMLAYNHEKNRRKKENLFTKHFFVEEDLKISQLSQIDQMVLLFFRKLALKLSLKLLGNQLINEEYCETLLKSSSVAFDIFPVGCIEQDPHWDYELPKSIVDDKHFCGASISVNLSANNQKLQIQKWDTCEYDSSLALTLFNRFPCSITLIDARLLHNEPVNKSEHCIFYMSLFIDPFDSNCTPCRKIVKFVNDMERYRGISIEYKICSGNLTITKKAVKQGNFTDSVLLKNLRENLITHLKDIEVGIIDQRIKSFVDDLENSIK